jgi:hypothetical protein
MLPRGRRPQESSRVVSASSRLVILLGEDMVEVDMAEEVEEAFTVAEEVEEASTVAEVASTVAEVASTVAEEVFMAMAVVSTAGMVVSTVEEASMAGVDMAALVVDASASV